MTEYLVVGGLVGGMLLLAGIQFRAFLRQAKEHEALRQREIDLMRANESLKREADVFRAPRGDKDSVIDKL